MSARDIMKQRAEKRKLEQHERLRKAQEHSDGRNNELKGKWIHTNPGLSNRRTDNKVQVIRLLAPISKSTIEFRLANIEPGKCVAHPANRRNQSMLRPFNPKVIEIKERVLEVGGVLEPVKAIPGTAIDNRYQLLDGSMRRYALSLANQEMRGLALNYFKDLHVAIDQLDENDLEKKIQDYFQVHGYDPRLPMLLTANCSPEDAAAFARTANEARSNESYWELAQAIERYKNTSTAKGHTQESLAKALGISRVKVTRSIPFTDIPEEIIKLFDSPDTLSESVAKHLINTVSKTSAMKGDYQVILDNVGHKDGVYTSATHFRRDLDALVATLVKGGRPKSSSSYKGFTYDGQCQIKITQNRQNDAKFKVDVVVDDLDKIKQLEKLLSEWGT